MEITILIVNFNSARFIENTLYCLPKITKHPYKVIIADNNSAPDDYAYLQSVVATYPEATCYRKEGFSLVGSMAHGTTLNELVEKVTTDYFVILDADALFLAYHWDETCIKNITANIKVIGTQASGNKPQDFPLMYSILFETKTFKELKIDFRPSDGDATKDTGYEMREKYMEAGFSGKVLQRYNTRSYKEGPFAPLIGISEYYLDDAKDIFAVHFGRGSSLGLTKYSNTALKLFYKIPFIGPYFLRRKGISEREKWFTICRSIVDDESNKA